MWSPTIIDCQLWHGTFVVTNGVQTTTTDLFDIPASYFDFHSSVSHAMELPSDDEGCGLLPIQNPMDGMSNLKRTRKTQTKPVTRPAGKPKGRPKAKVKTPKHIPLPLADDTGVSEMILPSDDEGAIDLEIPSASVDPPARRPTAAPCRAVRSSGAAAVEPEILDWESNRLKDAAAMIQSKVTIPYHDLVGMIQSANYATMGNEARDDLWEVYSCPRMTPKMRSMGGKASRSYDLAHYFDLSEENYQRLLIQDVCLCRPKFLMLSPPCRYVCQLMHSNWGKMPPQKRMLNLVQACNHIDMAMWLADIQLSNGNEFGFEHPGLSLAWGRESVTKLYNTKELFVVALG